MPNNLDPVPISINLSLQQFIVITTNIPPTINAPAFADRVEKFFRVLELEISIKSSEKILQLETFFDKRMKPSRCSTGSQAQRGYSEHHRPGSCPSVSSFIRKYSDTPCAGFATDVCRIWKLVHFAKCVQHF
jgi:hypothetical protein